jgi:hypothetical protein
LWHAWEREAIHTEIWLGILKKKHCILGRLISIIEDNIKVEINEMQLRGLDLINLVQDT